MHKARILTVLGAGWQVRIWGTHDHAQICCCCASAEMRLNPTSLLFWGAARKCDCGDHAAILRAIDCTGLQYWPSWSSKPEAAGSRDGLVHVEYGSVVAAFTCGPLGSFPSIWCSKQAVQFHAHRASGRHANRCTCSDGRIVTTVRVVEGWIADLHVSESAIRPFRQRALYRIANVTSGTHSAVFALTCPYRVVGPGLLGLRGCRSM